MESLNADFFQFSAKSFVLSSYNHFHNILRLFDVLISFPFTASETMHNYSYKQSTYELPHELPNDLRLGSYEIRKYQESV